MSNRRHPAGRSILAIVAGACLATLPGCGTQEAPDSPPPSILVISIDTLRADHLGCYGYFRDTSPNLDRLATESMFFTRHISTIATTLPSHVALWTSRHPIETGVHANRNGFRHLEDRAGGIWLFSEIAESLGYRSAAFVSATPVKKHTGLNLGFDVYDEPKTGEPARRGNHTIDRVIEWLQTPSDSATFLWVHLFDPHDPYDPPGEYATAFSSDEELIRFLREKRVTDPLDEEIQEINNLYDGEILFTDHQIGRLLDHFRASGEFDDMAIVVWADHGEGLGQHDRIGHGEIYTEQLHTPLMIKFPVDSGLNGRRLDRVISTIDVIPTLVDGLGLDLSREQLEGMGGVSALVEGEAGEYAFSQRAFGIPRRWGKGLRFSLTGDDWKFVYNSRGENALYDLRTDSAEIHNLINVETEIAQRMQAEIESRIREYRRSGERLFVEQEATEKVSRELRALGYLD